jgi:hypothetical protein
MNETNGGSRLFWWVSRVPAAWKGVVIIGAAFSLGATGMATASGVIKLPERLYQHVQETEQHFARQDTIIAYMERRVSAVERSVVLQNCLTLAELEHTPWQKCIPGSR